MEELFQEFENLPDTFLLFLEKLKKKISIRIDRPGADALEKVYTKSTKDSRVTIKKSARGVEDHFHFWVAKREVEKNAEEPSEGDQKGKESPTNGSRRTRLY